MNTASEKKTEYRAASRIFGVMLSEQEQSTQLGRAGISAAVNLKGLYHFLAHSVGINVYGHWENISASFVINKTWCGSGKG